MFRYNMESDLQNTSITDYSTNKLANHNTCATTSTTTSDLSDNNTKHKLKQHTKSNERNISIDQCDMTSLEILNKCHLDLFPKKKTICDDVNCMRIVDQLPILNGEYIHYIGPSGKQNEDILLATNFRIFLLMHESISFINVPIMLIESIEIKEIIFLYVYLKNAKTIRLSFSSSEKATLWYQRLNSIISKPIKLEELFAFTFYSWLTNEKSDESSLDNESNPTRCLFSKKDQSNIIYKEYKRMKFDSKIWRLTEVNKNFELCPSYPETVIIPKCMTDEQIKKIASFRGSKRFPAVVWRSKSNGAVLARSSQPNVGLLAWRLNEDELLIRAIADSSYANNNNTSKPTHYGITKIPEQADLTEDKSSMLLIIDARFRSVALANRVKGGGYEYSEYYTNCEIQFMNLENIHVIRSSFQSLRILCQSLNENNTFYSQLESTKWLQHLSGIIKAACTVTNSIDRQAKSVLIHCSDGWDRTPQILALAKLMLDPFYRTINGFRILIELDWLMFGHKFSQRNGHAADHNDINERCPVFLQWLDCVYQIQRQFPWAFEFNETFLLKLCYHSYSCLFGTFLCDSVIERVNEHIEERTFSIWSYLNDKNKEIINYLYDDSFDEIIYPSSELINMQLWTKLFCESEITYLINRQELQNFNDSVEASSSAHTLLSDELLSGNFLNGSSQQIDDDLELDINSSDLKLNIHSNSSLSLKSINTSSNTTHSNNNNGAKNFEAKKSDNNKQTNPLMASHQHNIVAILQKTRSYEDISKSFKQSSLEQGFKDALKKNNPVMDESPSITNILNSSLETNILNNLSTSDFPISIRSCSESNLLQDALQTIMSTSPKQICLSNASNSSFLQHNPLKLANNNSLNSIGTSYDIHVNPNHNNNNKMSNHNDNNSMNNNHNNTELIKTGASNEDQNIIINSDCSDSCATSERTNEVINEEIFTDDKDLDSHSNSNKENESFDITNEFSQFETDNFAKQKLLSKQQNGFLLNKVNYIPENTSTNSSMSSSTATMVRMQESTDTLVDEGSLINKKLLINSANSGGCLVAVEPRKASNENVNVLEDVFEMSLKVSSHESKSDSKNQTDLLETAINNLTIVKKDSSSTPLSSSIPSPNASMFSIHNSFPKPNPTTTSSNSHPNRTNPHECNSNNASIINTVSTSTSGLCDYVNSTKFRYINDSIKSFEKHFNEQNSHQGSMNDYSVTKRQNNNLSNGNHGNPGELNPAVKSNETRHHSSSNSNSINNIESRNSRLKSNEKLNGIHTTGNCTNKRIASKSIPIVRKNGEEKRKKKKTIQDCIDIDGLTKIEDKTCRKIVERDDQYKKEIASLKDQVNKCKSFLSTLTTNSLWQDGSTNFLKHELNDKSSIEDNQSASYSFSNDSVCSSSWDEIEESDYRLAPWVPDYYVTHCQNCNSKFSYRLRKHHCRNCGQVFCYQCADQFYPLPNHNLIAPARVCNNCKLSIDEKRSASKTPQPETDPDPSSVVGSFLTNRIQLAAAASSSKKILVQNQQGFYINALNNSQQQNGSNSSYNSLNQRCSQYENSSSEFLDSNASRGSHKVSV